MRKRNTDKLARAKARPDPAQWGEDEVMTLVEAAAVFFPEGPLTLSSLRGAAAAGTLEISKRPKDKNDEPAWAQHDLLLIRLLDLNNFFGDKTVSKLRAQLCRDFVDWSTGTPNENNRLAGVKQRQGTVSDQTARRRLEDLRAAVNAYHAEHTLNVVPKITLPPKAEGRHRWLTRN